MNKVSAVQLAVLERMAKGENLLHQNSSPHFRVGDRTVLPSTVGALYSMGSIKPAYEYSSNHTITDAGRALVEQAHGDREDWKMNETEKQVREILGGYADSHWGKRIVAAVERGQFTIGDENRAGRWTTCVCGGLSDAVPRSYLDGPPVDDQLWKHGEKFSEYVIRNNFTAAAHTLVAIEKRAAEVLAEMAQ